MMDYGRKAISEEAAAEMLPGYQLEKGGYGFDAPTGRIRVVGGTIQDQIYRHESLGMLNVSSAWEWAEKKTEPQELPLDDVVKDAVSKADITPEHMRKLAAAHLKKPALVLMMPGGMQIIDGHHRLARLISNGKKAFMAYVLTPTGLEKFQVRHWLKLENGNMGLVEGLTFDQAEKMIAYATAWGKRAGLL